MKYPEDYINKVIQGDCLEVMKDMPDKCVDLVLTDPPYGMDYQSSRRTDKYEKIENDVDLGWFPDFAKETYRILKNNTHAYIFCNDYAISLFRTELERVGFQTKRTLVWVKNNHTSGDLEGDYGNKTEFLLFVHKGRRELNGKRETNVLNFARSNTDYHPTQKPVELCSFLLDKSTIPEEIVFDPFMGGGSTLIASKQLNRKYIGIELSQKYCDIANERLAQDLLF